MNKPFSYHELTEFFINVSSTRCMVIGDVMVDEYIFGLVERISPEAPVPILRKQSIEIRAGGAANVALNLKHTGAQVFLCGLTGTDANSLLLLETLNNNNLSTDGILQHSTRNPGTRKTRIIAGKQQIVRMDEEISAEPNEKLQMEWVAFLLEKLEQVKPNVVVFEDYDKGSLNRSIIQKVLDYCIANSIPTAVDPKYKNFWFYKGCTLFKPNYKELAEAMAESSYEKNIDSVKLWTKELMGKLMLQNVLVTLSEKGVFYYSNQGQGVIPAHYRKIADVSGAGDTVIAIAALGLANNLNIHQIASLSNLAGGIVCEFPGVVSPDLTVLKSEALQFLA